MNKSSLILILLVLTSIFLIILIFYKKRFAEIYPLNFTLTNQGGSDVVNVQLFVNDFEDPTLYPLNFGEPKFFKIADQYKNPRTGKPFLPQEITRIIIKIISNTPDNIITVNMDDDTIEHSINLTQDLSGYLPLKTDIKDGVVKTSCFLTNPSDPTSKVCTNYLSIDIPDGIKVI